MVKKEFEIKNSNGLHTRPGNEFVKIAKQFICDISLCKGEKTVDGKSLLKIMKVNVSQGDTISINCSGPDEVEALSALGSYLGSLKE